MKFATLVVIALATATSTAFAQPGNTPPDPGGPPSGSPIPPPEAGAPTDQPAATAEGQGSSGYDIDGLIARIEAASPTLESIARGTLRRARRSVAFGPQAGLWAAGIVRQEEFEFGVTAGIALQKFKIKVLPSVEMLKALVMERAKLKLRDELIARFKGKPLDPATLENFAKEVWEEAVKEVLGVENIRPRVMERPDFSVGLEVTWHSQLGAWSPRVRLGYGISRVTVAGSMGVPLGAGDAYVKLPIYGGLEVATHFLTSKSPRSPVLDVFLRADFELRNRDRNTDMVVLGVRYLLDLI